MSATIELTLIARLTKDGLVAVDPPEKKVAMCVWRLYGRTLAAKDSTQPALPAVPAPPQSPAAGSAAHVQSGAPPARAEDRR